MKGIAIASIIVVMFAVLVFGFFGYKFGCQRFENGLVAKYENYENIYDNGWKEVKEKAQVEDIQVDDLRALYKDTMEGRYGKDGSKALLQFIKEQNPTLNKEVLVGIQQSVESFRNEFQQSGTEVVDYKRQYNDYRTTTWQGLIFGSLAGYPKLNLAEFVVITSDETEKAFKEKKAPTIKLREREKE